MATSDSKISKKKRKKISDLINQDKGVGLQLNNYKLQKDFTGLISGLLTAGECVVGDPAPQ